MVSNPEVDQMIDAAQAAGATGAKLTGAGGGGFLLLFVPPEAQRRVKKVLNNLLYVPFRFEFSGSQIIFSAREVDYSVLEMAQDPHKIQAFRENTEIVQSDVPTDFASLKTALADVCAPQEQGPLHSEGKHIDDKDCAPPEIID